MDEQSLAVVCDGTRLSGGIVVPDDPRGTVVLLHGIPSIAPSEPGDTGYPGVARRFAERGWAGAWADLRSVRASKGSFSIEGWVRDARAVLDAVRSTGDLHELPLALIGSSAGGAVATEVIARGAPADALVLLAAPATWVTYAGDASSGVDRILNEAGMALSEETLASPEEWFAEFERVTTERSIAAIKVPTLIVHGGGDVVVPVEHARRLGERAPRAEVRIVEGGGHQLRKDDAAMDIVFEWLDRKLGPR
jgi:alpha-beta hydrolase superfamily lysophospholipase